jgi:DNA/RNA endonuclease YhcR with UshA esterase domain
MLKKRTFFWVGIPLLLVTLFAWAWHLCDRPHQSAADETVALFIAADSLYRQYQSDEHAADQKYMGKVIEVTGNISEIQHNGTSEIWILSAQPGGGGINCELFPGAKTDFHPKTGDPVTVKGRCTGFLMDVNLADCVLSNK